MSEKQRNLLIVAMLLCGLSVVIMIVMVVLPDKYEAIVTQHTPVTDQTTVTTLPLVMTVNINTADMDDLMQLPDMTRQIAADIIDYRFRFGEFPTVDDLKEVDGVTFELYAKWASYIFV